MFNLQEHRSNETIVLSNWADAHVIKLTPTLDWPPSVFCAFTGYVRLAGLFIVNGTCIGFRIPSHVKRVCCIGKYWLEGANGIGGCWLNGVELGFGVGGN